MLLIYGLRAEKLFLETGELPDWEKYDTEDERELFKIIKESI
jgi:hypothetical protein